MKLDSDLSNQLIENSSEGIWVLDKNAKTVYVNRAISEMLGYPREAFIGKELSAFMNPSEAEVLKKKLLLRKDEKNDVKFIAADKSYVWALASCSPLCDESGEYVGAVGLISDLSERRKNETILSAQKNVFEILVRGGNLTEALNQLLISIESLIDGVLASILLMDEEGKHLITGASLHLPTGFSEAIYEELIGPEAGSCGTAAYTKKIVISSDISTDPLWIKYRHLAEKFDLKACWSSPILSGEGKVLGTFAMYFKEARRPTSAELELVKNITSAAALSIEHIHLYESVKKHNEEMNLIAEARLILAHTIEYEEVLNHIPELIVSKGFSDWAFICLKSDDGVFRTKSISARSELDDIIKPMQHLEFDLSSNMGLSKAMKEHIAFYEDQDMTTMRRLLADRNDGAPNPKHIQALLDLDLKSYIAVPLEVRGEVVGGLMVSSNKPGRKYRNHDLKLMIEIGRSCANAIDNAALYRESKKSVQAREDFISIASHELRTPLTSLKMRVDLLSMMIEKGKFPPEVMQKLTPVVSEIQPDIQKFAKLIETLLDISKLGAKQLSLNLELCDLTKVIHDEISRLKSEFDLYQTPLICEVQEKMSGDSDQVRLQQVIANLLLNALKFGNRKPVTFKAFIQNGTLMMEVKDQGIGFSPQDAERIFKPFERAVSDKHFGGLGLGLYITKQIVDAHRGAINVESSLGKGTSFIVKIPIKH
jgi:PAS domain S-box-containing protein